MMARTVTAVRRRVSELSREQPNWVLWEVYNSQLANNIMNALAAYPTKNACLEASGQWVVHTKGAHLINMNDPREIELGSEIWMWPCLPRGVTPTPMNQ